MFVVLILSRKVGQTLVVGGDIEITITEISGDKVKIGINAPKEIPVLRQELLQTVETNRQAAVDAGGAAMRLLAASLHGDDAKKA